MSPATLTKPTVNLVSKSQLAKLLATENITIEHSAKAHTASFDTNRRKLTLPIWNKASEDVYDMLVAHEVGHALITPKEGVYMPVCERVCPKNPAKFFGYLNIVEDIRVDLYIKNSFPGVRRSYFNAFNELLKGDFFDLKTRPLSSLAFGDRVNIYAKAGQYGFIDVPFSAEEQVIVDDAMKVSTFDEVCAVAERIYNQSKKPEQAPAPQPTDAGGQEPPCEDGQDGEADADSSGPAPQTDPSPTNDDSDESDDDSDAPSADNGQGDSDSDQSDDAQDDGDEQEGDRKSGGSAGSDNGEQEETEQDAPDLQTDAATNKAFKDLQDHSKNADYAYKNMPRINLDAVIFDYKTVMADLSSFELNPNYCGAKVFAKIQERNKSFVLNLVKQFEQKMAADTVRRTKYSRTGALDMRRISNYKFSDDLFLKNATVQSGKNHGMVFIMDWSGSMGEYLLPTVEQLIALCLFCRRMNIPFEVFAFTNSVPNRTDTQKFGYGEYEKQHDAMIAAQSLISPDYKISKIPGEYTQLDFNGFLEVHGIGMINFLSSKMSAQDFRKGAELFCQLAVNCDYSGSELGKGTNRVWSADRNEEIRLERIYSLSGTPLTEAAYVAIDIVNRFKVQNRLDIVNTVFLTDGEPSSSIGAVRYSAGNIVVNMPNRKQKMVYSQDIAHKYSSMYSTSVELIGVIEIFRELTGSNAISIHLTSKRGSKMLADRYSLGNLQKSIDLQKEWKDNDFFSVKDIGFTESFVIDAKAEIVDPDDIFDGLKDNASDAVIARTFIKGNQKQSTSRVLLNRFSDLIAKKVLA